MRFHARRYFSHHGFCNQMKFLPVAIHTPWQRPAIEGDDGLIGRPARRAVRRGGRGGGGVAGESDMRASGGAAACTRPLTAAAPARMAEPPMRLRREIMTVSSSLLVTSPAAKAGERGFSRFGSVRSAPERRRR